MSMPSHEGLPPPGARLERALEVFLADATRDPETVHSLLNEHADLRDLLEPMFEGAPASDGDSEDGVLGDFRLLEELGRGGMGTVYADWQRSLDRRVAVKVLAPALVASPGALARFRREAAAAGRLHHANIVEVYGFGSSGDRHFFAMQLVDGEPLHVCRARFRAPATATAVAMQLAAALAHAHQHGLVHRDVKPANVLVQDDGTVLLADFGVASDETLPSLTREGGFLGTLDYAAPEQVRGEAVDLRCDLWAVGVVLYELVTGEHPFAAATQEATMQRILTADRSLRNRPGISNDLAAVIGRALEKDPLRRYATAAALLADLDASLHGGAVSARLPTVSERLLRWTRREPWRALAATVLVIGVPMLAGSLGYLWANAPRIEAARLAEARLDREDLLARAWWHFYDGDRGRALAELQGQADGDAELATTRVVMQLKLGQLDAARAELAVLVGPTAELLRAQLDADEPPSIATIAESIDDFDCFVRAAMLFDRATSDGSDDAEQLRQALQLVQQAIALADAPRPPYLITLASVARCLHKSDIAAVAERALARHYPDSRVARRVRANSLARSQPAAALSLLADDPDGLALPGAWLLRGVAHEALGQLDESLAANRQAVSEQPANARAWTNLGVLLRKQKQLAESERVLRHAVKLAPSDVFAWNALALTLRRVDKSGEAKHAFARALELRKDYAPAAYNLGNLMVSLQDLPAAIAAYRRAVQADPTDVRAVANLGDALMRGGHKQEALQVFVRAIDLAPRDLIPHYNLARTALDLNLAELALSAARRANALDKKGYHGSLILAESLLAQVAVDAPAALAAAQLADQRTSGNATVRAVLAKAQAALQQQPPSK